MDKSSGRAVMTELVSIVMPAYNAASSIGSSIQSVRNQTFSDWKLYVVNDGSTDGTKDIVVKYSEQDIRIVYIENKKNKGVAESRNVALLRSKGDYIAFLDSDDIWFRTKLEKQLVALDRGYDVVCSNYLRLQAHNSKEGKLVRSREVINYQDMLFGNKIGNLTGVYNARTLGLFLQKPVGHEDYVYWLDILKMARYAYCIQEPLAGYLVRPDSLSNQKLRAARWQWAIYREMLGFGRLKSSLLWSSYVIGALRKRI